MVSHKPANPVLSARSTSRSVQNTGHADLVATADGGDALVLPGMRPVGAMVSFWPLGRETFITPVTWTDGWPQPEPVLLAPGEGFAEAFDFADPTALDGPGWLAVRATPASVASAGDGALSITGHAGLDDPHPRFIGRRQRHLSAAVSVTVDASAGAGGLAARYDEDHWFALEARGPAVTARAHPGGIEQLWQSLAARLARWLVPHAVGGWATAESVTVSTSTDHASASRLHVLHNWSCDEAVARPSAPVTDLLSGSRYAPAEPITLGAWDVRLLRSEADCGRSRN
jgi:Glycosyl hydrolases family 43